MCLPLIGAAVSAFGAISSANAQSASFKAQAKVNERQAEIEQEKGAFDAARARENAQRVTGAQIAAFGSSGVTAGGSPTDVIADSLAEANLDIGAIRFGSQVNADNLRTQAQVNRINARQARTAGVIGAISPFIDSVTQSSSSGTFLSSAFGT